MSCAGHVQFEITKNLRQRFREGVEVLSAYSSDSRPSTRVRILISTIAADLHKTRNDLSNPLQAGDDWDDLEWESKVELQYLKQTHVQVCKYTHSHG